jgi:hypothetical protein
MSSSYFERHENPFDDSNFDAGCYLSKLSIARTSLELTDLTVFWVVLVLEAT